MAASESDETISESSGRRANLTSLRPRATGQLRNGRHTASAQSYCNYNSDKCGMIAMIMTRIINEVEKSL
jgi:hypothetical protein